MDKKRVTRTKAAAASTALVVQTAANASNASPGESGATVAASALITVLVTKASDGAPVSNLGSTTGNQTSEISLPSQWNFRQGFNVPPGGCLMTPTEFVNQGNGIYSIRVVPFLNNPACKWLSGQYHYVAEIKATIGGKTHRGSGLGVLAVS